MEHCIFLTSRVLIYYGTYIYAREQVSVNILMYLLFVLCINTSISTRTHTIFSKCLVFNIRWRGSASWFYCDLWSWCSEWITRFYYLKYRQVIVLFDQDLLSSYDLVTELHIGSACCHATFGFEWRNYLDLGASIHWFTTILPL